MSHHHHMTCIYISPRSNGQLWLTCIMSSQKQTTSNLQAACGSLSLVNSSSICMFLTVTYYFKVIRLTLKNAVIVVMSRQIGFSIGCNVDIGSCVRECERALLAHYQPSHFSACLPQLIYTWTLNEYIIIN